MAESFSSSDPQASPGVDSQKSFPRNGFAKKPAPKTCHVAHYGNVKLIRAYCKPCQSFSFIQDHHFACCDRSYDSTPAKHRRLSEPPLGKKLPSPAEREAILQAQQWRCLYCSRMFGQRVWVGGRSRLISLRWDHKTPHAYSQDNNGKNFAAACQFCNGWKSDLVFQTVEEAAAYLMARWETAHE